MKHFLRSTEIVASQTINLTFSECWIHKDVKSHKKEPHISDLLAYKRCLTYVLASAVAMLQAIFLALAKKMVQACM